MDALRQALGEHQNAALESIELEEDDGRVYWEVELKGDQGNEIELEIAAIGGEQQGDK
ncbi:MAG TPA: PepSY domain-containing protein [Yaniella sp.]